MIVPQTARIVFAGLYTSGFLALSAHRGMHGITDFSQSQSPYLTSGALVAAFFLCWYYLAGREIRVNLRMRELDSAVSLDSDNVWDGVISLTRLCFLNCLSAALFSVALLGNLETWSPPSIVTLGIIAWLGMQLDHDQFPRVSMVLKLVTQALGIGVFFTTAVASDTQAKNVFLHFVALSVFYYLIERQQPAHIFRYAVLVLLSSSFFGALHLKHISSSFGGGQPRPVEIMIGDPGVRASLEEMGFDSTPSLMAKLVHETPHEFIVDLDGQIVRLARKTVAGLKMLPVERPHWLLLYLN